MFYGYVNNQGFKRLDLDSWEFENEGFVRGKRHLLSTIVHREAAHGQNQQPQQTHGQSSRVDLYAEFDEFVLEKEIQGIKRDNNMLKQEIVKSRKQQQTTDTQLEAIVQRLDGMEQKQQEMMSILFKDVNIPDCSAQFEEEKNESSMLPSEGSKKRRLELDVVPDDHPITPDGQILSPDLDFKWDNSSIEVCRAPTISCFKR